MQRVPTTSAFTMELFCVLRGVEKVQLSSLHSLCSREAMMFYIELLHLFFLLLKIVLVDCFGK